MDGNDSRKYYRYGTGVTRVNTNTKINMKKAALPLAAAVVLIIVIGLLLFPSGKKDGTNLTVGEPLKIRKTQITKTASFYPVTIDGTGMEVLAILTSEGEVRTAFNTCQHCYSSGKGYYMAEGAELVCQNCGFRFTAEDVGIQAGGCRPWPVPSASREDLDDEIRIPYEVLAEAKGIFSNWHKS